MNEAPYESTKPAELKNPANIKLRKIFTRRDIGSFALTDTAVLFIAFIAGVGLSPWSKQLLSSGEIYFTAAVQSLLTVLIGVGLQNYEIKRRFKLVSIIGGQLAAVALAGVLSIGFTYLGFYSTFGRLGAIYGSVSSYVALCLIKLVVRNITISSPLRVGFLGESSLSKDVTAHLNEPGRLFQTGKPFLDTHTLSNENAVRSILDHALANRISIIAVSSEMTSDANFIEFAFRCSELGIDVTTDVDFYSIFFEKLPVDHLTKEALAGFGFLRENHLFDFLKRSFDIISASLALAVLSPFFLLIMALIKLTSKGPVFFIQPRMGRRLIPFEMIKFRTMYVEDSKEDASGGFTKAGDVRVTTAGKLLRPLHLDELPQLINIIKGDMSVVGPRPEATGFARSMHSRIPFYYLRYMSRPGLTGHAQISMGYAMDNVDDTKEKLSYDFYYLTRKSFLNDLKIILQTVFHLAKGAR